MGAELLERRDLLAVITVDSLDDNTAADGVITLREAILAANHDTVADAVEGIQAGIGADVIQFAESLFASGAATLEVTMAADGSKSAFLISDALTINGPGANLLTIDAAAEELHARRVFRVSDGLTTQIAVELRGLTMTGGLIDGGGPGGGGAIKNSEALTITECAIVDNTTLHPIIPPAAWREGGGILSYGPLVVRSSTISGNSAARGGAIFCDRCDLTIENSTLSGNYAELAGAIYWYASDPILGGGDEVASLILSTVTDNTSDLGGAVYRIYGDSFHVSGSIVSGNLADGLPSNLSGLFEGDYNLVGAGSAVVGTGNITADVPHLGPLADNGGLTWTHPLLPDSPAVDAGDPAAAAGVGGVPLFDQRGAPHGRVVGGRIDIGAFEAESLAVESADFDEDGDIDGVDFLRWQRGFGTPNATKMDVDADNDTDVDEHDLAIWRDQFGLPAPVAALSATDNASTDQPVEQPLVASLVDAAIALEWMDGSTETEDGSAVVEEEMELLREPRLSGPSITWNTGTTNSTSVADSRAVNDKDDKTEESWVADELLECVFG